MTSVKAALLSFVMLSAIVLCGLGIYAADAANNHQAVDGYGVASLRKPEASFASRTRLKLFIVPGSVT